MARSSVGRRARRSTQRPSGTTVAQYIMGPTTASILRPIIHMIKGVTPNTMSAHPSCSITCSRRCAAERRAARSLLAVALDASSAAAVRRRRRRQRRRSRGSRARRAAMEHATTTLALVSWRDSSQRSSSISRSCSKAAEALAGPAHRQRALRRSAEGRQG
eukprot:scaffold82024_cov63-Phaeocystis_antarctica.AAC.1